MTHPDPTQYDTVAGEYADHAETAPYNALYDRPAMLELLGDVSGKRVFDAGCGPGFYLEELLARGADVLGCDASRAMVDLARERVGDGPDLRVQRLDAPFPWVDDASIDTVLSALVYHYLGDRRAFLAEVHRILRPNGTLVISTHHPTNDWVRLGGSYFANEVYTEVWSRGWEISSWRLPLTTLVDEFADAGFQVERLVEPQPLPEMAESHPKAWEKLTEVPAFIMFRLVKG